MNMLLTSALAHAAGRFRRKRPQSGIRILYYHGVVERKRDRILERNLHLVSDFREQVRFLKSANVIGLDDLKWELEAKSTRSRVLITVDDGYRNNLLLAEILAYYRLPFIIFVSSGLIGSDKTIWTVELSLLLLHGVATRIEACGGTWALTKRKEREVAFHVIRNRMKQMPADMVRKTMDLIRSQFPKDESLRLLNEFSSFTMLTWKELSGISAAGGEIGSHGVEHHLHHANQSCHLRIEEIQSSKTELTQRLGRPCRSFSFPNGDFTQESEVEIARAGYEFGFTTQPAVVQWNANPYLLPRFVAPLSPYDLAYIMYWGQR